MNNLEYQLKYLKEKYGISTLEQLREEMKKAELDIGIFTMPITFQKEGQSHE